MTEAPERPRLSFLPEVLLVFLRLGLTSFGGPIAHIGYFRSEIVERRKWVHPEIFADLVALCQVLPGAASSQLGFAIGTRRAGLAGGLAAWAGFTLPSAAMMVALGLVASSADLSGAGWVHGLKLAAVAVVAQAVSLNGAPYTALPNAFKYRQEFNAACSCRKPGQSWAQALGALQDDTVEQGDIVVNEQKAKALSQPRVDAQGRPIRQDPRATKPGAPPPPPAADNSGDTSSDTPTDPGKRTVRSVGPTFVPAR